MVTQQWYDTLTEHPFFSSKFIILLCNCATIEQRGKTITLLKEGSKVLKAKRQRKQHPVMLPDKEVDMASKLKQIKLSMDAEDPAEEKEEDSQIPSGGFDI